MIAAAASDGRIDASEHETLVASLTQAGAGGDAEAFIAQELNRPRSVRHAPESATLRTAPPRTPHSRQLELSRRALAP